MLQEMAARVSIVSGKNLGTLLKGDKNNFIGYFVGLSVVLGCAAYEAGNILGATSGLSLIAKVDKTVLTLCLSILAAFMLWFGKIQTVSKVLGVLVAVMGGVFIIVAFSGPVSLQQMFLSGFKPKIPEGSEWLVLALIGTTIVPYNIYLGSGLSMGRQLKEMRFGLFTSVLLGGIISMAILLVGTQADQIHSFIDLATILGERLGAWAYIGLGIGLFAAGFTSSVTAPMAAGIVVRGFLTVTSNRGMVYYRIGWMVVLLTGLVFGVLDTKPLPVILAAQALNGLILPVLGVVLIVKSNDIRLLKSETNSLAMNIASFVVLEVLLLLGLNNLWKAIDRAVILLPEGDFNKFLSIQLIALVILLYTILRVIKSRRHD